MRSSSLGRTGIVPIGLWILLGCCCAPGSSTTSKEPIAFRLSLLDRAVDGPATAESKLQPVPDDVSGNTVQAAAGDSGFSLAALRDSTSFFSALPTSAKGDEEDGFLQDVHKYGQKRFLLIVLFVGGLIRYLTSASFRRFIAGALDPLEW